MIRKITLKSIATYNDLIGAEFEPSLINFIYGCNGSGKTTISNVIEDETISPNCIIDRDLHAKIRSVVYNQNFIKRNFEQAKDLKGIFTLGEGNQTELNAIIAKKDELNHTNKTIFGLNATVTTKRAELQNLEVEFEQNCWDVYLKYKEIFLTGYTGYKNSRANFKAKILSEFNTNNSSLLTFHELEDKSNTILNQDVEKISTIQQFEHFNFGEIENNSIFSARIIGKDNVDIARIIMKLNNSDWVKQGIKYYEANENTCPFCQQITDDQLKSQLAEYFDETFLEQINELKAVSNQYIFEIKNLLKILEKYKFENHKYINYEVFNITKELLESESEKNSLSIQNKEKEPTIVITIESILPHLQKITDLISSAEQKTIEHNTLATNIKVERENVKKEIWKFTIEEIRPIYKKFTSDKTSINSAKTSCSNKLDQNNTLKNKTISEIGVLEKSITNITDTINTINKTLKSFGFVNFELKESETQKGYYEIIRANGTKALKTLSEGEKTFLTFLYFYHLLSGSIDQGNITEDKIVVIDDPISSLDSSVLFIVSNLCRKIVSDCQNNLGNIKQVFILTHNVYFHKEVTFVSKNYKMSGISFWTVNKRTDNSIIKNHFKNPIQTSYDLLWQEIRDKDNINTLTIFNTLRRILEYYFKILGKVKDDNLLNKFEGSDKIIGDSLMSWINDGSHLINDDIYIATDTETVDKYLEIFRRIFLEERQIEHYNMMMGVNITGTNDK